MSKKAGRPYNTHMADCRQYGGTRHLLFLVALQWLHVLNKQGYRFFSGIVSLL